jgi:hypothetical protein
MIANGHCGRDVCGKDHRLQLCERIEGQVRGMWIYHERCAAGEKERMAVGLGFDHGAGSDGRGATWTVLNDHRLSPLFGKSVSHRAGDPIISSPGRERHHDANGFRWKILCRSGGCE